jgi:hypothetical protein
MSSWWWFWTFNSCACLFFLRLARSMKSSPPEANRSWRDELGWGVGLMVIVLVAAAPTAMAYFRSTKTEVAPPSVIAVLPVRK